MKPNLNVDRVSLEERIKKLEEKAPTVLPGTGIASDVSLDPKLVDQVQPNSFTDLGTGLLWYLSIDNFYDLTPTTYPNAVNPGRVFNGFELKIVRWMPRINGQICSVVTQLCRARIKQKLTNIPGPQARGVVLGGTYPVVFEDSQVVPLLKKIFPARPSLLLYGPTNTSGISILITESPTSTEVFLNPTIEYQIYPTQRLSILFSGTRPNSSNNTFSFISPQVATAFGGGSVYPEYAFPMLHLNQFNVYVGAAQTHSGSAFAGAMTVPTPADLPDELKPMYPPSWTV